jgi:hypothetical protein
MEKLGRFLVGLVAFAVLGATGYYGLQTAGAQTGGGYPSNPNFQTLRLKNVSVFAPQTVVLGSNSGKTSTTTFGMDPTLVVTVPSAGTYYVYFSGQVNGMLSGQGGIMLSLATSTAVITNSPPFLCGMFPNSAGSLTPAELNGSVWTSGPTSGSTCFYGSSATYGGAGMMTASGIVTVTASTNIGVNWTQAASNATTTNIIAGASLLVWRIL